MTSDGSKTLEESVHLKNNDLVPPVHPSRLHVPNTDDEASCCCRCRCRCRCTIPGWYGKELRSLLKLAWPMLLVCLMQYATTFIAIIFCGRLRTSDLAGVSLAISLLNIACISASQGLASACDTLFAQSFGSENKKLMGVYLQRGLILLFLGSIVVVALILNGEKIFLVIGENAVASRVAGEYLLFSTPGAVAFYIYQVLSRYILNQNRVIPMIVISVLGNIVNAVIHYLLMYQVDLGHRGSSTALSATYISLVVMTIVYIFTSKMYEFTWAGWTFEAFHDWGSFMRLAIAGMLMCALEYLMYEIGIIFSAFLGDAYVSALAITFQLGGLVFQTYIGVGVGTCIRVGQHLGSGDGVAARQSCIVGLTTVVPLAIVSVILFVAIPQYLARIFTNDIEVIDIVAKTLLLGAAFTQVPGAVNMVACGILRASGRQTLGMLAITIPYLLVGLPISLPTMMLTSMTTNGYFLGMIIAISIECAVIMVFVYKTDWDKELEKAAFNTKSGRYSDDSEKTGLLSDSSNHDDTNYGAVDIPQRKQANDNVCRVLVKRLCTVFVILLILAAGILVHFYVKVGNELPFDECQERNICNSTATAFPTKNITTDPLFAAFS